MRLWSIHPKYLDTKGLIALWREGLLAKNVLEGKTKGYKNHPQLLRFKNSDHPIESIHRYLEFVYIESAERGYHFDRTKIEFELEIPKIEISKGQLEYEKQHLLKKLSVRDYEKYNRLKQINQTETHPLFQCVEGEIENWEKIV